MENFATQLFTMFFALAIVIALAWLALRALKTMQYGKATDDVLRFKRALPVGTREKLVLVEYRGHDYLIGVTAGNISLLEKRPIEIVHASSQAPLNEAGKVAFESTLVDKTQQG